MTLILLYKLILKRIIEVEWLIRSSVTYKHATQLEYEALIGAAPTVRGWREIMIKTSIIFFIRERLKDPNPRRRPLYGALDLKVRSAAKLGVSLGATKDCWSTGREYHLVLVLETGVPIAQSPHSHIFRTLWWVSQSKIPEIDARMRMYVLQRDVRVVRLHG